MNSLGFAVKEKCPLDPVHQAGQIERPAPGELALAQRVITIAAHRVTAGAERNDAKIRSLLPESMGPGMRGLCSWVAADCARERAHPCAVGRATFLLCD